jgi:hypothetical protein
MAIVHDGVRNDLSDNAHCCICKKIERKKKMKTYPSETD